MKQAVNFAALEKEVNTAGAKTEKGVLLSTLCTYKVGGPAALLIKVETPHEAVKVIAICKKVGCPLVILGKGSNILFADKGFNGAVLQLSGALCNVNAGEDNTLLCGAGASLTAACRTAAENSLTGLEFAFGIPGSIGGAVFMNAGAYGGEMAGVIKEITYLTPHGSIECCGAKDAGFSYRTSKFQNGEYCILQCKLGLEKGTKEEITKRMQELAEQRTAKQPLNYPSMGSAFKRPKTGFAAALIEECGLKGKQIGGAAISEKHSGFIVNLGGATAKDTLDLAAFVEKTVFERTGVQLEREFIYIN